MTDRLDDQLRSFFRSENSSGLPSNFSWLVMQRIGQERIARARSRAQLLSLAVSVLALLCGIGLFIGYKFYISAPVPFFELPTPAVLSATTLFAFWFLDTLLKSKG